ncbi:MAG: hypothetical protein Q9183_004146 [Haloplaca sp. 2 TL-2023]
MANTRKEGQPRRLGPSNTKQHQTLNKSKNAGKRSSVPQSRTSRLLNCYIPKPSGVRKKQSTAQWKGFKLPKLPKFAQPYRKVIAGVPTLVLELLPVADSEDASGSGQVREEIPMDSESDASVTTDNDHGPDNRRDRYEQDIDVFPHNTKIEGARRASDPKIWQEDMAKFIRGPMGRTCKENPAKHSGGWVGKKPLGQGGQGMAGMWERVDENGQVHQIAVKQISQHRSWNPEPPRDVPVMKAIKRWSEKYGEKNTGCVEYKNYVRYRRRKVHRIYMLLERSSIHMSLGILPVRGPLAPPNTMPTQKVSKPLHLIKPNRTQNSHSPFRRFLPELFLWDLFYSLALACRTLSQIPSRGGTPGWGLVHLDLKPGNVFLAPPRSWASGGIPLYPTARLGDFGCTTCTSQHDRGNPKRHIGTGTPGYRPFEQQDFASSRETEPAFRQARARWAYLGSPMYETGQWTNIWGIAAVVFEMMMLDMASNYLYPPVSQASEANEANEASSSQNQSQGHSPLPTFPDITLGILTKSEGNPNGYSEELAYGRGAGGGGEEGEGAVEGEVEEEVATAR